MSLGALMESTFRLIYFNNIFDSFKYFTSSLSHKIYKCYNQKNELFEIELFSK